MYRYDLTSAMVTEILGMIGKGDLEAVDKHYGEPLRSVAPALPYCRLAKYWLGSACELQERSNMLDTNTFEGSRISPLDYMMEVDCCSLFPKPVPQIFATKFIL
jgi:hypothetical protein